MLVAVLRATCASVCANVAAVWAAVALAMDDCTLVCMAPNAASSVIRVDCLTCAVVSVAVASRTMASA